MMVISFLMEITAFNKGCQLYLPQCASEILIIGRSVGRSNGRSMNLPQASRVFQSTGFEAPVRDSLHSRLPAPRLACGRVMLRFPCYVSHDTFPRLRSRIRSEQSRIDPNFRLALPESRFGGIAGDITHHPPEVATIPDDPVISLALPKRSALPQPLIDLPGGMFFPGPHQVFQRPAFPRLTKDMNMIGHRYKGSQMTTFALKMKQPLPHDPPDHGVTHQAGPLAAVEERFHLHPCLPSEIPIGQPGGFRQLPSRGQSFRLQ